MLGFWLYLISKTGSTNNQAKVSGHLTNQLQWQNKVIKTQVGK